MTPEQIELVQSSWQRIVPITDRAAQLFYSKLFSLDPSLRPLFKGDMKEQGKKLMATLNLAVASLTKLETILPTVEELGRRHAGYGVLDEHYDTVGEALLSTLEQALGEEYTDDVAEAWTATYVTLSTVMKEAASQPEKAAG